MAIASMSMFAGVYSHRYYNGIRHEYNPKVNLPSERILTKTFTEYVSGMVYFNAYTEVLHNHVNAKTIIFDGSKQLVRAEATAPDGYHTDIRKISCADNLKVTIYCIVAVDENAYGIGQAESLIQY